MFAINFLLVTEFYNIDTDELDVINNFDITNVLFLQFSGCNADRMKKVYGTFCSRHNEAVNLYKELHAKDKRFQALIKVCTHL